MKKCLECNSEKIIENAKAIDRSENHVNAGFSVAVDEHPNALMFKQRIFSETLLKICADCGFIQFYAKNPEMLWIAYQKQKKNVS